MFKSKAFLIVSVLLLAGLLSFGALGCETDEEAKGTVEILYVEWDCAKASTYVAKAVLEDMGYEVVITSVSAPLMYSALATGDGDFMTTAWLPVTHGDFMDEYGDQLDEVATNYTGIAVLGWFAPTYVEFDSIDEINDYLDELNGQITGIDPGSGIMHLSEDVIAEYGLDVELIEGSDATMAAALQDAISREEAIVVTGWSPHWKLSVFDLKKLDDPKGILGADEYIATIARQGLEDDMPEVYAFLQNFIWSDEDIGAVMDMNLEEDSDPAENARTWVEANQDIVQQWIP